jgi:hypothetical protein
MSDDRPAIKALNEALERHNISRDSVSVLNRVKLDILFPEPEDVCPVCHLTDEQSKEPRSIHIHPSCWEHIKFPDPNPCDCGAVSWQHKHVGFLIALDPVSES